ncbi:hypothetical protein QQF64_020768 [Cirrhinus molitorella]|uniref:Uncharacterized protein n=1 Tax=Cirrhinus molitorella TaxID=172907 RepID=A0ABR3LAB2_9TELE
MHARDLRVNEFCVRVSVAAFEGGGARGVAWRRRALNAFARVAAETEGRHSARAALTSAREFPRLGDICPIDDYS